MPWSSSLVRPSCNDGVLNYTIKRMNSRKLSVLLGVVLLAAFSLASRGETPEQKPAVTMADEGTVSSDGLWLTRRMFGRNLAVHGDCLKVYKGYIFITWYEGGMDNRTVCISRKKIGGDAWQTIKLPHRHVMFRGDKDLPENERRGDTHNTIALGISPKDDTIHLVYDMHAYTPKDFPNDYFNYTYSKKGAAVVPDDQWKIDLFNPKQNYLNEAVAKKKPDAYHAVTYPNFLVTPAGNLLVHWRYGGTTNATMSYNLYDGESWSAPWIWNRQAGETKFGIYGGLKMYNGRLYYKWSHKTKEVNPKTKKNIMVGPYMAYCEDPDHVDAPWFSMDGQKHDLPLKDLEPFKLTGAYAKGGFVYSLDGKYVSTSAADEQKGETSLGSLKPAEGLFVVGKRMYAVGLIEGKPAVLSSSLDKVKWDIDYQDKGTSRYSEGVSFKEGNSIFYGLVDIHGPKEDCRPIRVVRFDIAPQP